MAPLGAINICLYYCTSGVPGITLSVTAGPPTTSTSIVPTMFETPAPKSASADASIVKYQVVLLQPHILKHHRLVLKIQIQDLLLHSMLLDHL